VIDETIVQELSIDEENTWFEQIPTKDGILLKIQNISGYESDTGAQGHRGYNVTHPAKC
jgi:hypothetical protein